MTTSKLTLWFLQSASAAALALVVLTSPLMAQAGGGHQDPVEGESCTDTCARWNTNGYEECRNSANPAQCNQNLTNNCNAACANGTVPVGFTCDMAVNSTTGGPTTGGCVGTANPTPGAEGCSNGCWANGPCANTTCSRAELGNADPNCACRAGAHTVH